MTSGAVAEPWSTYALDRQPPPHAEPAGHLVTFSQLVYRNDWKNALSYQASARATLRRSGPWKAAPSRLVIVGQAAISPSAVTYTYEYATPQAGSNGMMPGDSQTLPERTESDRYGLMNRQNSAVVSPS